MTALAALTLTACSSGGDRMTSPKQMVGLDQADIRQCMGQPARTAELGTRQIWSYEGPAPRDARKQQYASATPPPRISGMAGEYQTSACVLHIEFKRGEARDVSYYVTTEGRPGDKDKRCAFLAYNCQD
jgi:hypothetical protein